MTEAGGKDSDGRDTQGMVEESGLATGLQPGGTIPSGGVGNTEGAIGTGGGSNDNRDTGTLKRWDKGQHQESGK